MIKIVTFHKYLLIAFMFSMGTIALNAQNWSTVASMANTRFIHTATLLSNGKVLVAGGNGSNGFTSSCELYDPTTNTWSTVLSMTLARKEHSSTLLPNGKVLVVGGYGSNGATNSCELYDPVINNWSLAASMSNTRAHHTATLLSNGKVLVAGGNGSNGVTNSCELYDPTTNTWSTVLSMAVARQGQTSTLLSNGKVLVAGGVSNIYLNSCELYDPVTNSWSAVASMSNVHSYHTATLLFNGKVLVAGGFNGGFHLNSCELYDTATNTWSAVPSMTFSREGHSLTLLSNGNVLVVGGHNSIKLNNCELYNSVTNSWSSTASMLNVRTYHTATILSSGKVLVAGGDSSNGLTSSCELYTPLCTAPTFAVCPLDIQTNTADGSCTALVNYTATATASPDPAVTYTLSGATTDNGNGTGSGIAFNSGITNVAITASNGCGNDATCNFMVKVIDNQIPTFTCPADQTVNLDSSCKLVVPDLETGLTGSDNCGTVTFTQDPLAGTELSSSHNQTHNVVITANDGNGNTNQCTVVLTAKDVIPPPLGITTDARYVYLENGCKTAIPDVNDGSTTGSFDFCSGVTITQDPPVGTIVSSSHNEHINVTVTATDGAGNTNVKTLVLTAKDVYPPILTPAPNQNVNLDASCMVTIPNLGGSATDNCPGTIVTQIPDVGAIVPSTHNGTINVTVTATDEAGLTDVKTLVLTAKDVTPPPLGITTDDRFVYLENGCITAIPDVNDGSTTGSFDFCSGVTITQDPPVGTIVSSSHNEHINVTVTATDGAGNTNVKTLILTAKDVYPPILTPAPNQNVNLDASCMVTIPDLGGSSTNNCPGTIVIQNPDVGTLVSSSHNGTINVTVTATDEAGLTDVKTVILTAKDVTPPILIPAPNQNVNLDASCMVTIPDLGGSSTNNCPGTIVIQNPDVGTLVSSTHNGTINVTVTARDEAGLTDVKTVILTAKDVTPPPLNITTDDRFVYLENGCITAIPDVNDGSTTSSFDFCSGVTITQDPPVGTIVSSSHNEHINVTVTATDGAGNTNVKTLVLTAKDVYPPILTPAPNQNVNLDASCIVTVPNLGGSATDNCPGTIIMQNPDVGSMVSSTHNGIINVTLTAIDVAGLSETKTVVLTAKDVINPSINCPAIQSITRNTINGQCTYTTSGIEFDVTAADNCAPLVLSWNVTGATTITGTNTMTGTILNRGVNTIIWTATDLAGNTATCTLTVTVKSNVTLNAIKGPSSVCMGSEITLSNNTLGGIWTSSNTSVATVVNGKVKGIEPGSVTISYISPCGIATKLITVNDIPVVLPITGASTVIKGAYIILSNATIGGSWSSSDNFVASVNNGKVTGKKVGTAIISYSVTNSSGCITTVSKSIAVVTTTARTVVVTKTTITPFNVIAYPNPFNHHFTLSIEGGTVAKTQVMVYDSFGRLLKRIENATGNPIELGEELAVGQYLVIVKQGTNKQTIRLIKIE